MTKNKENLVRAHPAPTDVEIELAVERLSPNWAPRCPSVAHWRHKLHSYAVVLEDQTFAPSAW